MLFAQLYWRILCESVAVIFGLHENIVEINEKLNIIKDDEFEISEVSEKTDAPN